MHLRRIEASCGASRIPCDADDFNLLNRFRQFRNSWLLNTPYSIVDKIVLMSPSRKTVSAPGAKRVTLKFIAEYLNLSPTTVSVVLTNSPLASTIAKQTKDRIWEAVNKFQYRPNLFARYLHSKRT